VINMDAITATALAFTWIILAATALYFQGMVKTLLDINDSIMVELGLKKVEKTDEAQTSLKDFSEEE